MTCQEIIQIILDIEREYSVFCNAMDQDKAHTKITSLLGNKKSIESKVDHTREVLYGQQTRAFTEILHQPQIQQQIAQLLKAFTEISDQGKVTESVAAGIKLFDQLAGLFSEMKVNAQFNTKCYHSFEDYLESEDYRQLSESIIDLAGVAAMYYSTLNLMINSIFLNKFMKEDTELRLEKPIDMLRTSFGLCLEKGRIYLDEAGDHLGANLRGAKIHVRKAGRYLGGGMIAGKIFAGEAESAGDGMTGGYIAIRKCKSSTGSIGDLASGGLIYSLEEGDIGQIRHGANLICEKARIPGRDISKDHVYAARMTSDSGIFSSLPDITIYSNLQTRVGIGNVSKENLHNVSKMGLMVWFNDRIDLGGKNPTENLSNGVVVMYSLLPELGKGMTGGAIILEIPGLTIEAARSYISPDKKGGAILLRVSGADGKSRLVDIEDEV